MTELQANLKPLHENKPKPIKYSNEYKELLKKKISGWVRQSRYRARQANKEADINYDEVVKLYEDLGYHCAYCDELAQSPDHPFPIKYGGPCTQANILPCCDICRSKKKMRDIVRFYQDGHISQSRLHKLIGEMVKRRGGNRLKYHIKSIYHRD